MKDLENYAAEQEALRAWLVGAGAGTVIFAETVPLRTTFFSISLWTAENT